MLILHAVGLQIRPSGSLLTKNTEIMKRVTLLSTYSRLQGQYLSSHDTPRHLRPIYGNLRLKNTAM